MYYRIMSIKSFKGGVHPPEKKDVPASDAFVQVFPSTKTVWIPVSQSAVPNNPIVKVGDSVARGQKIAESEHKMSVPVHSSVSGTVKKIENHLVLGNTEMPCIMIQIDEENREEFLPPLDPFSCTKEEAIARIRDCGICGMGGAAFPTHIKLSPPPNTKIEYVLANGAECEPYLTTDAATMYHSADDIVDGLSIVMHILSASKGIIVLEDNKTDLVPFLEKALAKLKDRPDTSGSFDISIQLCKTKYPQGGEKNLVEVATGRQIPSGGLPFSIGCAIQNVGTLKAVSEAFRLGKPLIDRPFTVSGDACKKPFNGVAPIGTCVGDLIPEPIELDTGIIKIISGGPMMGMSMKNADFPIQKNTSGILFLTEKEASLDQESPCIRCGRCIGVCSCRLTPVLMVGALKAHNYDMAVRCGLLDCVECGTCSYICPARVQLVQWIKIGKRAVIAERKKQKEKEEAKKRKEAKMQVATAESTEGAK